ncbi:hypothetical protein MKW92_018707 [Papaver armeniacum]|nr:hypothetical protein MKW92_018707 [Papaver armeniacum]
MKHSVGENPEPKVNLPSAISKSANLHELISKIYPGIEEMSKPTAEYMTEKTILSPRNDEVSEINKIVLEMYNGESHTFLMTEINNSMLTVNHQQVQPIRVKH